MPEHGGKRTPRNPAPASGPGQLSQRTDGGPQQVQTDVSGMPYGENQELEQMQNAAPMNASPTARSPRSRQRQARSTGRQTGQMGGPGLMSPTQRPDEPVTAGAPFGPGAGPSGEMASAMNEDIEMIKQYLPDLEMATMFRGAPKTFVALVNYLRSL